MSLTAASLLLKHCSDIKIILMLLLSIIFILAIQSIPHMRNHYASLTTILFLSVHNFQNENVY